MKEGVGGGGLFNHTNPPSSPDYLLSLTASIHTQTPHSLVPARPETTQSASRSLCLSPSLSFSLCVLPPFTRSVSPCPSLRFLDIAVFPPSQPIWPCVIFSLHSFIPFLFAYPASPSHVYSILHTSSSAPFPLFHSVFPIHPLVHPLACFLPSPPLFDSLHNPPLQSLLCYPWWRGDLQDLAAGRVVAVSV